MGIRAGQYKLPLPGLLIRASAITASFSTGLREHVEYTILPSFSNSFMARCKILT